LVFFVDFSAGFSGPPGRPWAARFWSCGVGGFRPRRSAGCRPVLVPPSGSRPPRSGRASGSPRGSPPALGCRVLRDLCVLLLFFSYLFPFSLGASACLASARRPDVRFCFGAGLCLGLCVSGLHAGHPRSELWSLAVGSSLACFGWSPFVRVFGGFALPPFSLFGVGWVGPWGPLVLWVQLKLAFCH